MNWGSVAVDERRQLMVVNNMHLPFVIHDSKRARSATGGEGFTQGYGIGGQQRGTPFFRTREYVHFASGPTLYPAALWRDSSSRSHEPRNNLASTIRYRSHVVTDGRIGVPLEMGTHTPAGSIVTGSGLIFIGGVMDGYMRAIDLFSGEELFADPLHAPSSATPMSYVSPQTGKQYVLLTVPARRVSKRRR